MTTVKNLAAHPAVTRTRTSELLARFSRARSKLLSALIETGNGTICMRAVVATNVALGAVGACSSWPPAMNTRRTALIALHSKHSTSLVVGVKPPEQWKVAVKSILDWVRGALQLVGARLSKESKLDFKDWLQVEFLRGAM